ncbi:MAG: hypothetical protein U0930_06975 [Pirellulales bacterium]
MTFHNISRTIAGLLAICFLSVGASHVRSADSEAINKMLTQGRLKDCATQLKSDIAAKPDDQLAQAGLGVCEFLQAVEKLGQDQYRFGLLANRSIALPMMRLPLGENPKPDKLDYASARKIVQNFVDSLMRAEEQLAKVKPADIKLRLRVDQIRLDLNGNDSYEDDATFGQVMQSLQNARTFNFGGRGAAQQVPAISIAFDDADVLWLRGYCHVMAALGEVVLAYDWKDQFERTAHLFYPNVETPYAFLLKEPPAENIFNSQSILDGIALIHTFNYECTEPARMKTALAHLESVIDLSRKSWKLINQETDDDEEWLPNINQKSVVMGVSVSKEMQMGWSLFLDEMEAILQGKKLAPFWRGVPFQPNAALPVNREYGINVRKIFTEPKRFDLVLAIQGTGIQPFLEKGKITSDDTWNNIGRAFRGNFMFFMFWAN